MSRCVVVACCASVGVAACPRRPECVPRRVATGVRLAPLCGEGACVDRGGRRHARAGGLRQVRCVACACGACFARAMEFSCVFIYDFFVSASFCKYTGSQSMKVFVAKAIMYKSHSCHGAGTGTGGLYTVAKIRILCEQQEPLRF